ncbi:MAG: hypothetical protein ACT4NV_03010 [Rhodoferax sp.]
MFRLIAFIACLGFLALAGGWIATGMVAVALVAALLAATAAYNVYLLLIKPSSPGNTG